MRYNAMYIKYLTVISVIYRKYVLFLSLVSVTGAAPLTASHSQAAPPRAAKQKDSNVIEVFRVDRGGERLILMPTTVFGKTVWGAIDTGSDVSLYDVRLRPLLGALQGITPIATPQGSQMIELFVAPRPSIGKYTLHHDSGMVLCHDLRPLCQAAKLDVRVILGMDVLRRSIIRIDSNQGVAMFLHDAGLNPAMGIPFLDDGSGPSVMATLGDSRPERFVLDTGSVGLGSNMLSTKTFDALVRDGRLLVDGEGRYTGALGSSQKRRGRLNVSMTLGKNRHDALVFSEGDRNALGLSYLSRYIVTLDFPHHLLFLEKRVAVKQERAKRTRISGM